MILGFGTAQERFVSILLQLLKQQHTLDGKKVAVLGGTQNKAQISATGAN